MITSWIGTLDYGDDEKDWEDEKMDSDVDDDDNDDDDDDDNDNDDDDDDDDDDSLGRVELVVVGGKHMKGDTPPTPPLRAHYPAVHTSTVL